MSAAGIGPRPVEVDGERGAGGGAPFDRMRRSWPAEAYPAAAAAALGTYAITPDADRLAVAETVYADHRLYFEATTAGQVVKISQRWRGVPATSALRGDIREWSMKSRIRALQACYSVEWPDRLVMVTLTYPGAAEAALVARKGVDVKRHLEAFKERWRQEHGAPVGLWKLEFQRRGAPHVHLWLERPAGVSAEELASWVAAAWAGVVGSSTRAHIEHGTQVVEWIGNPGRYVAAYTRKTATKEYQHQVPDWFAKPGRFWGMWGLRPGEEVRPLTLPVYLGVRRALRRYQRSRGRSTRIHGLAGLWAQTESPAGELLRKLLQPPENRPGSSRRFLVEGGAGRRKLYRVPTP